MKHAGWMLLSIVLPFPLGATPAEQAQRVADDAPATAAAWPTVASNQTRAALPVKPLACGGEACVADPGPDPMGGGTSNWGACNTNKACSLEIGACYTRTLAKCQVRLSGTGNPCQSC